MYEAYWKLSDKPFRNTADGAYSFCSPWYDEALVRLQYGVNEHKGLMLVTGPTGCGKSFLLGQLMEELEAKGYRPLRVQYPDLDPREMLQSLHLSLGLRNHDRSRVELWHSLVGALRTAQSGTGRTVLVLDDAHLIRDPRTFELLGLLLRLEYEDRPLLTIVMAGLPGLWDQLRAVPTLHARIAVTCETSPLSAEESIGYIAHRLSVAGATNGMMFTEQACWKVHYHTEGVPRRINDLCDLTLLIGCGEGTDSIDADIVSRAVTDFGVKGPES